MILLLKLEVIRYTKVVFPLEIQITMEFPMSGKEYMNYNPLDSNDGNKDSDKDGYTNVEEYLNELAGDNN